jgi:hypothetical protein
MVKTVRIEEDERERMVANIDPEFPKYTTQLINQANQNAQATRPRVVGQMSEIIEEYKRAYPHGGFQEWQQFYLQTYDGEERIEEATQKTLQMVNKMREAAKTIDEEMIRRWLEDLVLYKTYSGLGRNEEAILKKLTEVYGLAYSLGSTADESKGIDGYLGDQPVSIKPLTYQQKDQLQENINAPIVYYEEYSTTDSLTLHLDELEAVLG